MNKFIVIFLLFTSNVWAQSSLTVKEGDIIEFRATEVTTLDDGNSMPAGDVLLYQIQIIYENGIIDKLLQNDPMQFVDGTNIIVESNATKIIGAHRIEAWVDRVRANGSISSEKTILSLTVEEKIDNRAPAKWIITIHPKAN